MIRWLIRIFTPPDIDRKYRPDPKAVRGNWYPYRSSLER
jgi:hypothetical protein